MHFEHARNGEDLRETETGECDAFQRFDGSFVATSWLWTDGNGAGDDIGGQFLKHFWQDGVDFGIGFELQTELAILGLKSEDHHRVVGVGV